MPSTILGENALQLPAGTTRPTGSTGMIRYDTTNRSLESFYNPVGPNAWGAVAGASLIARSVRNDAWNVLDIVWGWNNPRYEVYEVFFLTTDPATSQSRYYCQFYDAAGNLFQNSGTSGYAYNDNWGASNDGADFAGANFNSVNSNCSSSIPITHWGDVGYRTVADGESHIAVNLRIFNSLPMALSGGNDFTHFEGTYTHRTVSNGSTHARFGGSMHRRASGVTPSFQISSKGGMHIHPITGIRFGILDGNLARPGVGNGINTIVTVYGLTGTEEREL